MDELNMARQQRYATVRIAARETVLKVATDGTTHGGKLATYLVMTPRKQPYLKYMIIVAIGQHAIVKHSLLRVLDLMVVSKALVHLLITHNPMYKATFRHHWTVLHYSPISLVDLTLAEHIVKTAQRLRRTGKNNQPTDRTVKTMGDTKEHVTRLGILLLDICLHIIRERSIASLVALDDLSAFLVHHYNVVIFINYFQLLFLSIVHQLHVHATVNLDNLT